MIGSWSYGQSLPSPRATGIAAYGPLVSDTRGFPANPAGITGIRDWELSASTYFGTMQQKAFVFDGVSLGKKLTDNTAIALQYSPGASLQFIEPTTYQNAGRATDREIQYREILSFGLAQQFGHGVALGFGGRLRTEELLDTRYQIADTFTVSTIASSADLWSADLGILWKASPRLTLGMTGVNLVSFRSTTEPAIPDSLQLPETRCVTGMIAYRPVSSLVLSAEGGTDKHGAIGCEWHAGAGVSLRTGLTIRGTAAGGNALAIGAGWNLDILEFDASWLRFFDRSTRTGGTTYQTFDASDLRRLDYNRFATDRLSLSAKVIFGNTRDALIRIESVSMSTGIYPSSYQTLAYRPVGVVVVRNITDRPVMAKASFFVDRYMDAPTESDAVSLFPGEKKEIPLHAVFNDLVRGVASATVRDGDVRVSATPTEYYDDKQQTRVVIHGKNDWDGDALSLRYFVTTDDPAILRFTRDVLWQFKDSVDAVPKDLAPFKKARILFNAFSGRVVYVNDPKQSSDYVQYPAETLFSLRGGDCDDMTVCYSSLLNSIGISTAFIDVVPPDRPAESHIYLMFDTGMDPRYGSVLSDNPKRLIVRSDATGRETVWLPVETTLVTRGFDEAWQRGAQEYLDDTEVHLGLVKGWVRIVDVH